MEKYGIKRIVTCEMLDRHPEVRFDIVEEMTRELVGSIVQKLHEGEKIVNLSNVSEFQEVRDFQCMTVRLEMIVTIDSLIRCRDCKYQSKGSNECESWNLCGFRPWLYVPINDDDFCSKAVRREP